MLHLTQDAISVIILVVSHRFPMITYAQKQKYRITLEVEVMDDFDPYQIEWKNVLLLEGNESCQAYIEDLSRVDELKW